MTTRPSSPVLPCPDPLARHRLRSQTRTTAPETGSGSWFHSWFRSTHAVKTVADTVQESACCARLRPRSVTSGPGPLTSGWTRSSWLGLPRHGREGESPLGSLRSSSCSPQSRATRRATTPNTRVKTTAAPLFTCAPLAGWGSRIPPQEAPLCRARGSEARGLPMIFSCHVRISRIASLSQHPPQLTITRPILQRMCRTASCRDRRAY